MANEFESIKPSEFVAPDQLAAQRKWRVSPIHLLWGLGGLLVITVLYFVLSARAVLISVTPEYADVQIRDGFSFPMGDSRLLLRGTYDLLISAEGYEVIQSPLIVNSGTPAELSFQMQPLPGDLNVKLLGVDEYPMGDAMLFGNDLPAPLAISGQNELLFQDLPAGTYQLTVDANLYAEQAIEVEVPGRNLTHEIEVQMQPNWGWVSYETSPGPAALILEETLVSALSSEQNPSAVSARVEAGTYEVQIELENYKPVVRDIVLEKEQEIDFGLIELEHVDSKISVSTSPEGVSVLVNQNYVGETPLVLDLLPDQIHQLELFKAGFQSRTEQVSVEKNGELDLEYQLAPDLIQVSLSLYPENASLKIAGNTISSTNGQVSLPAIKHLVEVSAPGYESKRMEFLPVRGTRQHLQVRLMTEQQALWANIPPAYRTSIGQEMKLFRDAGEVQMGSSRRETGRRANETNWTAMLERPFYVGLKEVTNREYKAFEPEHSSGNFQGFSLDGAEQPVINVSWQQAALYANWLSQQEGLEPFYTTERGFVSGHNPESTGYRLLTEAEWTWLAKMSATGFPKKYMWGDSEDVPGPVENYADQSVAELINFTIAPIDDSFIASAPVGSFAPNEKGLYDLAGNVNEWIHDWYDTAPYKPGDPVVDPLGPEEGEFHVIRGASWARGYLPQLRLAYRDYDSTGRNDLGFRLARYAM